MENLLNHKNPKDIIQFANSNHVNDSNSYLWNNLLIKYYFNFNRYKNKNISIKDYYVLLYYSEILGLINFIPILERAQYALSILPKIYDGDHLAVINACTNISIISNSANIILYRDKFSKKVFGSGFLTYQYKDVKQDLFVNSNNLSNYKNSKYSNNLYGYVYH